MTIPLGANATSVLCGGEQQAQSRYRTVEVHASAWTQRLRDTPMHACARVDPTCQPGAEPKWGGATLRSATTSEPVEVDELLERGRRDLDRPLHCPECVWGLRQQVRAWSCRMKRGAVHAQPRLVDEQRVSRKARPGHSKSCGCCGSDQSDRDQDQPDTHDRPHPCGNG
jgi:hypothetical protein